MLNIHTFKCNPLEENCYVIWPKNGSKRCFIVDCGAMEASNMAEICRFIESEGLIPVRHLLTHGHFDHIWGAFSVYEQYNLQPDMLSEELETYENASNFMRSLIPGMPEVRIPPHGELMADGQVISNGYAKDLRCRVIATPGHTPGGCCYYFEEEKVLISGDTLFKHSYGRTDFPGGSSTQLLNSLRQLMELPDDVMVIPGHGETTTIGAEKYII